MTGRYNNNSVSAGCWLPALLDDQAPQGKPAGLTTITALEDALICCSVDTAAAANLPAPSTAAWLVAYLPAAAAAAAAASAA
jgi:hypothetical protein